MTYLNAVVNGLLVGGLFAGVGAGLSLIFGISNMLNLAHGGFILIGAYGAYLLQEAVGVPPVLGVVLVAVVAYGLGNVLYRYGGLRRAVGSSPLMVVVFTFALDLVIVNLVAYHYGGTGRSLDAPGFFASSWSVGGVVISISDLCVGVAGILLAVAIDHWIKRTRIGRGIRATRQDRDMAALNGVDVVTALARTFGIGCAVAAVAGVLIGLTSPFNPSLDSHYLVIAFAVVIVGGLGRVDAVIAGGLAYGVVLGVMSVWLGSGYGMASTFALLLVLLLIRPQGILGSDYY
jgi:branched-chain amino acid transport system permease protein